MTECLLCVQRCATAGCPSDHVAPTSSACPPRASRPRRRHSRASSSSRSRQCWRASSWQCTTSSSPSPRRTMPTASLPRTRSRASPTSLPHWSVHTSLTEHNSSHQVTLVSELLALQPINSVSLTLMYNAVSI